MKLAAPRRSIFLPLHSLLRWIYRCLYFQLRYVTKDRFDSLVIHASTPHTSPFSSQQQAPNPRSPFSEDATRPREHTFLVDKGPSQTPALSPLNNATASPLLTVKYYVNTVFPCFMNIATFLLILL